MGDKIKLRLTGRQYVVLQKHLMSYTSENTASTAIAFCGTSELKEKDCLKVVVCINKIYIVPQGSQRDLKALLANPDDNLRKMLLEAKNKNQVALLVRNKSTLSEDFINSGDENFIDEILRAVGNKGLLIKAFILQDGSIKATALKANDEKQDVDMVSVAGDDIKIWHSEELRDEQVAEHSFRTAQTFGKGTTALLSKLTVGVIGVSGTGSPTVEMLYRLGTGRLLLVDPDIIQEKNIGRIYNSSMKDVEEKRYKVDVLADAIAYSGLPTEAIPINCDIFNPNVVRQLAQCDIIFGCMDSIDGRDLLNRIASFYLIPYFDLGVGLEADGKGGINRVCGTVHYLQPDGSSLFSRGVYNQDTLSASSMYRTNPKQYKEQLKVGYIKGINEDKPAVISINTLTSSIAVNDFLARIHPYRDDSNSEFSTLRCSLSQSRLIQEPEGKSCEVFSRCAGRGDIIPLLGMPVLSERE
jgi:hypothetical protein